MGSDGAHATSDVVCAGIPQRFDQAGGGPLIVIGHGHGRRSPTESFEELAGDRPECRQEFLSDGGQFPADLSQLGVPYVQGHGHVGGQPTTRLLQERVSLPQDPFQVGAQGVVPRVDVRQEVVQPPAPPARTSLDHSKVLRTEHRRPEVAQQVPHPGHLVPVHEDAVASGGQQLGLQQDRPLTPAHLRPDDRLTGAMPYQGLGRGPPERRTPGQPGDRLDQVGLPLPVASHNEGHAGIQAHVDRRVVPEVGEPEPVDCHGRFPDRRTTGSSATVRRPERASAGKGTGRLRCYAGSPASASRRCPAGSRLPG